MYVYDNKHQEDFFGKTSHGFYMAFVANINHLIILIYESYYRDILIYLLSTQHMLSGTPVSSTNKIDRLDITEILLKVALNTIPLTPYFIISYIKF